MTRVELKRSLRCLLIIRQESNKSGWNDIIHSDTIGVANNQGFVSVWSIHVNRSPEADGCHSFKIFFFVFIFEDTTSFFRITSHIGLKFLSSYAKILMNTIGIKTNLLSFSSSENRVRHYKFFYFTIFLIREKLGAKELIYFTMVKLCQIIVMIVIVRVPIFNLSFIFRQNKTFLFEKVSC